MNQGSERSIASAQPNMQVESLSFAALPHQSRLFLEYLRDPSALKGYYPNVTDSPFKVGGFAGDVLENYETDRAALCDALVDINSRIGAGKKTFANIDLLRDERTVAVVTGQQAGLFTGPLYTIYKALSAVKLADELTSSGTAAVPVFWIATEDHDLDEVAHGYVTDKNGEVAGTRYKPTKIVDALSVGEIKLDGSIRSVINELFSRLAATEFSPAARELLLAAYVEGRGFGEAFGKTLARLFADLGLVVIDPLDDTIKQLAAPIYERAVRNSDEIVVAIREKNNRLAADGFHSQVLVDEDYFPLFWHDDEGKRVALRKVSDGVYRAKGRGREVTITELEKLAIDEPTRFSPGVMLRSVVQDHLLPTICYFGGAAEIAYFAQNSVVYEALNRPVTPIFHRQSFTIVESRQRRTLSKFGWSLTDLFDGREQATIAAVEKVLSPKTAELFHEVGEKIEAELDRLGEKLSSTDPTLAANLVTRRRKIAYHIAALKKKALMSEAIRDETTRRQIDDLFNSLVPNGGPQERTLNVFGFINRHGFGFIDVLYNSVDLDDKGHRMIYL